MKNWLIRTSDKKILGPVTREKIIDLIKENKLSPVDEVCLGNDFWFYLKEKQFVQKFFDVDFDLTNDGVLSQDKAVQSTSNGDAQDEVKYPTEENTAYPADSNAENTQPSASGSIKSEPEPTPQRRVTDKKKK